MEINFARKISLQPLCESLISGVVVTVFCLLAFWGKISLSFLLGLGAFLIESALIYPTNLTMLYGNWHMDSSGVYFYDYQTFLAKLHAIFLPSFEQQQHLSFEQIKSIAVFSPSEVTYLGKKPPVWIRKPYYIVLTSKAGQMIKLDLSWNLEGLPTTAEEIQQAVKYLKLQINKP